MDTIISYLDNMFKALPRTGQVLKLKQDLLAGMEEKYYELKSEGRSENEAIGIVISEFGNIDELVSELGVGQPHREEAEILPYLSEEETMDFLVAKIKSSLLVAIGTVLCIAGAALLILISSLGEDGLLTAGISENTAALVGLVVMFVLVALAVCLFIYSGMKLERFKYMQAGFELPYHLRAYIMQKKEAFNATYTLSLITGVCLCVLSPVAIFMGSAFGDNGGSYGVVILLAMVAVAVFLFTYYGSIRGAYSQLLKTGEFSEAKKEENRVIGAVAGIVWPLATCIFLISGLVYEQWHINWIVFPITGLLFGVFGAVYSLLKKKAA
ncbi:hypothetical protein SAMN02799630_02325 [Paenibacillus sp. UNCCL117]|uniref:permease prefix domain 1-containing protein n=1 Tax=unclassified Paenibacillus TaxID=185978 RepID=UPI00089127F4|nr:MULTISPECIES: permease prefix domain 1-containing protein [unclassified Paenibacillus]SDD17662.1 hypothetical protein SAMN04488602_106201 [Paenibacillus sp. cl123]SFW35030.1 hypothetical protein SAMN02799630_02325 [Paenibacillus sp. UNCCL117]